MIVAAATYASLRLFRSWRAGRAVTTAESQTAGLWERIAARFPDALDVVGPFTLNGFGIRYLDFHGVEPDGVWGIGCVAMERRLMGLPQE